jgi:hypothetical protein
LICSPINKFSLAPPLFLSAVPKKYSGVNPDRNATRPAKETDTEAFGRDICLSYQIAQEMIKTVYPALAPAPATVIVSACAGIHASGFRRACGIELFLTGISEQIR